MSSSARVCILVVENHADTHKSLVMFLEDLGYTTVAATNFAEARAAWREKRCEVLISDIGLPDGNGWDLLSELTEEKGPPRLAIAMSGYGMSADKLRSRAAGFRHHLVKPFDPQTLEDILREAMPVDE